MERLIEDERGRRLLAQFIERQKLPFVASVKDGRHRSLAQNRLLYRWAAEAAMQREDVTPLDVASEWKLRHGTPILCADNDDFAAMWAIAEKKLTYPEQLDLMRYVSVTSLMNMTQLKHYLDAVFQESAENGLELTDPERLRMP